VSLDFSRPGKPTDDAFIEAFNSRFRAEYLNAHWLPALANAEEKMEDAIGQKLSITLLIHHGATSPPS
jgi:putative transposase